MTTAPPASGAESETTITRSFPTVPPGPDTCELCGRAAEPAWPGHPWCARCVGDLCDALDRRRAAKLRLPPHLQAVA